jgi:poly-beta-hydroxyalkanoate depolymerase
LAASLDLFERATRRYGKPFSGSPTTVVDGNEVTVAEERVLGKTFCRFSISPRPGRREKLLPNNRSF